MSLEKNLQMMELGREKYWLRYPHTSPVKLRWRALTVRHSFHVLPGEKILEMGAGTGLWTEHLTQVLRGQNPITAAVFNEEFVGSAKPLPGVAFVHVKDLQTDLPAESFDYIVGTAILCHDLYAQNLRALYRLLKRGGQILFFEANYWNPQIALKDLFRPLGRWAGNVECQVGLRKFVLMKVASQQGFVEIDIVPYDIVHPRSPRFLLTALKSITFLLEHAPGIRELSGTLYIWAKKPGDDETRRPRVTLANHESLYGSTSFVIPCHNEEMNVRPLVDAILGYYDPYVHEIVIVNDNSSDRTAAVTIELAQSEPRVRLVDRKPPNGVGRALREGYAAATGRYILTMDCDFVQIMPEFRDLFDVIAAGHDGAIGSRFSHESLLINYPFLKILCNRGFHLIANLLLPTQMRDISNNLKLYRAEILKSLNIEQPGFAANAETGLKPLLSGFDIREVPISWINRTIDMGTSSFRIRSVAPGYVRALTQVVRQAWGSRNQRGRARYTQTSDCKCPVCSGTDIGVFLDGADEVLDSSGIGSSRETTSPGRILRCRTCKFGFRESRFSQGRLTDLYRKMDPKTYQAELRGRSRTAERHLQIVDAIGRAGHMLDVGCASGLFLTKAADAGWQVTGVEPSEALSREAMERLAERGTVLPLSLAEAKLEEQHFDAITLWDVLEHVADPAKMVRQCRALLRPGGCLFLNVPDLDSFEARALGRRWPLLLPEHLNYFNRRSLKLCCEKCELQLVRFGRRRAFFSVEYVLHRLSQHRIPGARLLSRISQSRIGQWLIPVSLGETYAVFRRT